MKSTLAYDIANGRPLRNSKFNAEIPKHTNGFYVFNNTEPNLHFTESEEDQGKALLRRMGVEAHSWFICFHSRDSVYLSDQWVKLYPMSRDWSYQDFRDCDTENYLEAAKYIASLDGFAVRMGYGVAKRLPDLNNPRIIDYATQYRTDFGDVYLPAKCKFFLGTTAGLYLIATIFHVPVAWANTVSLDHSPFRKGDLYIPKKIWSIQNERFLTFREQVESGVASYYYTKHYVEAGLEVVENNADEVLDLAREMNERLDGTFEYTEEDEELQSKFRSLLQPHHISYDSPARMGAIFLRKNKELLE